MIEKNPKHPLIMQILIQTRSFHKISTLVTNMITYFFWFEKTTGKKTSLRSKCSAWRRSRYRYYEDNLIFTGRYAHWNGHKKRGGIHFRPFFIPGSM